MEGRCGQETSGDRPLSIHTDASLVDTVKVVGENPSTSMYLGFNANAFQLIGTVYLESPASSIMYDWSHCYLQDGL